MISRETISVAMDTVRKAYETEDVDRAMDLFESIVRMLPDEGEETSPQQDPTSKSKVSGRSVRSAGGGESTPQEKGFSEPRSTSDGEGSKTDPVGHREGIHDPTLQPTELIDPSRRRTSGGLKSRDEVLNSLTDNQSRMYQALKQNDEGLTTTAAATAVGKDGAPQVQGELRALQKKGLIEKIGEGRGSKWKVIPWSEAA